MKKRNIIKGILLRSKPPENNRRQPGRLAAVLLSLYMVMILVPVSGITVFAMEGDGTEGNPYQITTQEDLAAITGNNHYILMNDIELTGDWTPLSRFSGTLNGNGKTITGLNIESDSQAIGLFTQIDDGGVVKDLTLYGTVTSARTENAGRVGGFAGINNGTISGCTFYGSVSQMQGDNQAVGGIAGLNGNMSNPGARTIENCKNYGDISGFSTGGPYDAVFVGGIAGSNHGNITTCSNAGIVYASAANANVQRGEIWGSTTWMYDGAYVGGIAGDTDINYTISGNTSTGTVVGENSGETENLISIQQPDPVSVPLNTSTEILSTRLPSSVVLETTAGTSVGSVTWDTTGYDSSVENATYTFTGTVTPPSYVTNNAGISLTTTIEVTVGSGGQSAGHSHNVCGGASCSHDGHNSVTYTALDPSTISQPLTGGNYYLTDDILTVSNSIQITGPVNLCLNGHTISGDASNGLFRIGANGVLTVCDCQGDGKIEETGNIAHNPVFLHSGGTLNLYSGTIASRITAVVIDEDPSATITNSEGGTVNVYGGTVSSTGSDSQAIKVNAALTGTDVSISGGEVTSPNNGISSESGAIRISGGSITAQNGYALDIGNTSSKVYLSGSPVISGGSAGDVRIQATSSWSDAVLVLHAMNDVSSVYTGTGFSISPISTSVGENKYVAQGVSDAGMLEKFSLAGADDYYLTYNATDSAIQMNERPCTITLPSGQAGYTVTAAQGSTSPVKKGGSYRFTVTVDSANKYYKTGNFAVKANGAALTPDSSGVYTISNINADQTVTVEGVALDNTLPTAEITLDTNKWNQFLNNITFGLFFKDTRTVTISASDTGSGVEKTEYFVSDTAYTTSEALENAAGGQWNAYSASFSITPDSKNIIYAKVTDNVGNVGYVSSQGIVLYTDAAQDTRSISFTRTGTTDVTARVTLNGNTIDEIYCGSTLLTSGTDYTVNGNTITFKASWLNTLSAGNHTLTIHYNPLGAAYVNGNGNTAPATTAIALLVYGSTDGQNPVVPGENPVVPDEVQDITADNVNPSDKEILESAKEEIENALKDHSDSFTEDEKRQLEETLQQIEEALEVIQRVENVEEAIGSLPESVNPDDIEAKEQIEAAREQYDALSDYEKTLVSAETIDKLNALLAQFEDPLISESVTTDTADSADNGSASPGTGDDSHIVPWIMMLLISGGTVLALSVKHRNKKA